MRSPDEGYVPAERTSHPPSRAAKAPSPTRGEGRELRAPCQRAVDHRDRIRHAVDRDERAKARAFFLAEQDLVEHVEPVERNARPTILALLHLIQKRLAAADL